MRTTRTIFLLLFVGGCTEFSTATNSTPEIDPSAPAPPVRGAESDASTNDAASDCAASGMTRFGSFCIDRTEVTNAQYASFTAAVKAPAGLPERCAWKTGHEWSLPNGSEYPVGAPLFPVVGVDWCDAYAFCAWSNKRLCTSQEFSGACSDLSGRLYPYGDLPEDGACNVDSTSATAVGSRAKCGQRGVYDLVGNVSEWSSVEVPSAPNEGLVMGGSFMSAGVTCVTGARVFRNERVSNIGFRCCADR